MDDTGCPERFKTASNGRRSLEVRERGKALPPALWAEFAEEAQLPELPAHADSGPGAQEPEPRRSRNPLRPGVQTCWNCLLS